MDGMAEFSVILQTLLSSNNEERDQAEVSGKRTTCTLFLRPSRGALSDVKVTCFVLLVVQSQFNALTLPEKLTLLVHAIGNDQSVEVSLHSCLKGLYREGGTDNLT